MRLGPFIPLFCLASLPAELCSLFLSACRSGSSSTRMSTTSRALASFTLAAWPPSSTKTSQGRTRPRSSTAFTGQRCLTSLLTKS